MDNVTEAERKLLHWQFHMSGSFTTSLFDCMANADPHNLRRLAAGFPDEVAVYERYTRESGYWEDLKKRGGCDGKECG